MMHKFHFQEQNLKRKNIQRKRKKGKKIAYIHPAEGKGKFIAFTFLIFQKTKITKIRGHI